MIKKLRSLKASYILGTASFLGRIFVIVIFLGFRKSSQPVRCTLTLNRSGFLQIGMAGAGKVPPCNFCLNGPVDLEFAM